jgi:type I restriction enzyme S subunit
MMTTGWKETFLGDVLTERRETPTPESLENGEVSIVSKIGFNQGKIELRSDGKTKTGMILIRPGDLVISGINAAKGAIAIYDEEQQKPIAATIHYGSYIPNKERVEVKYLWWFLRSAAFREIVQHHVPGGIKTELKAKRFLSVPILLPPVDTQRSILERIEAFASRISKARFLREVANREADILFSAQSFKLFAEIKEKHETKSFGSFSPHVTSGPRYWRDRYSDIGHRFYRAQDIGSRGNILPDSKAYVTPPESDQGKTALLEHGDLMIVITGATVGRCAIYTEDLEPGYVSQHVSICRLPQDKVLPKYALLWLLSPDGQQQLLGQRYGQGKPGLNLTNIRSIVIPVPPLDEQRRIVAYLDSVQARLASLRELQSATREELSALLPSVLDKAFKGEL